MNTRPTLAKGAAVSVMTLLLSSLVATSVSAVDADEPAGDPAVTSPTVFDGRLGCGQRFQRPNEGERQSIPDSVGADGVERSVVSAIWRFPVVDMSDDRFDGRYLGFQEGMDFRLDGDEIGVFSGLWQITNDGGEWVGAHSFARLSPTEYSTATIRMDGRGGYEGLTAVMEADWRIDCGYDIRGLVVEQSLPEFPDPVEK